MKLSKLVEHIEYELVQGSLDTEVADIAYDSRKIKEGMLFVAIAGTVVDGHKYIPDVVKKGASVLVVEKEIESIDESITVIRVANGRAALSLLSQAYFDYPASKMISIGITGTKGKSTTTYMIRDIIEKSGKTCGIVGTIGVAIAGKVTPTEHTTPESYDLQRYFKDMVGAGCEYMVMEVSSQGIKMDRVAGMHFNYGIFTNITPDHIGPNEHADFNEYLYCKSRLFTMCDVGIVNRDDPHWKEMIKDATCEIKTYGTEDADTGADGLTVHAEACADLPGTIAAIRESGAKPAVCLSPKTPLSKLDGILDQVDMVLIMGVEPGFGGQTLIWETLEKVKQLHKIRKERGLFFKIEIDGGVTKENARAVAACGVDIVVAGTAVFRGDIEENIHVLQEEINTEGQNAS